MGIGQNLKTRNKKCYELKRNGIYVVKASTMNNNVAESSSAEFGATLKWQKRLAHVGEKGLRILYKKGVFGKDSISKLHFL